MARLISFFLTLWFFYILGRFILKGINLFLKVFLAHGGQFPRGQSRKVREDKKSAVDTSKVIDAEFEEIE